MLQAIFDPILPIFAVLAVGYILRKVAIFDATHATAINRFVFYLAAPALVFVIFARAPLGQLNLPVLASYFAAEVIIYSSIAVLARKFFHLPLAESLLLGMTAIFANHVFFVRPIAILVYGESVVLPIGGIIIIDVVAFCLTVFMVDAITSGSTQIKAAAMGLLRNPFVITPVLGVLAWYFSGYVPTGLFTFADFAGAAAAPVSLFALGVVLAGVPLWPIGWLISIIIAAKLLLHPLLVFVGISAFGDNAGWQDIAILVAAGPCGAMPFVIAVQYGVAIERIAKAILFSTLLSILTLSFLI